MGNKALTISLLLAIVVGFIGLALTIYDINLETRFAGLACIAFSAGWLVRDFAGA